MSWQPSNDPVPGNARSCDAIEHVIVPRARDLGGFEVRRALPAAQKQMVERMYRKMVLGESGSSPNQ